MADIFSKKKRSLVMSRIRGRGNKATELALRSLLRENGIKGWRRHLKLPGTPDFAFVDEKTAVFVDGCFWHGCSRCGNKIAPTTNRGYWLPKIKANQRRDRRTNRNLRLTGWRVLRIWEHDLKKKPEFCVARIKQAIS